MADGDISVERTARKRHRCAQCYRPIEPGQRYVDWKQPPGGELGYKGWLHARFHLPADHLAVTGDG